MAGLILVTLVGYHKLVYSQSEKKLCQTISIIYISVGLYKIIGLTSVHVSLGIAEQGYFESSSHPSSYSKI